MRNLYKKYEGGGIQGNGDPRKVPPSSFDILGSLVSLIKEGGAEVVDALQDILQQNDMDDALEEFNEKADQMPTARGGQEMRPGREDLRNLPAPREMRSRQAKYVPGGSDYKPFVKFFDAERQRQYNDTSGDRKMIGRTNPNVGEGINPRRRLFRRR